MRLFTRPATVRLGTFGAAALMALLPLAAGSPAAAVGGAAVGGGAAGAAGAAASAGADFAIPCVPSFGQPTFFLGQPGSPAGTGVQQGLTFFGWAGLVGQEQANIQIAPGTPAGVSLLSIRVPNFFPNSRQLLPVKLGPAN
jgi:hypothetical protein